MGGGGGGGGGAGTERSKMREGTVVHLSPKSNNTEYTYKRTCWGRTKRSLVALISKEYSKPTWQAGTPSIIVYTCIYILPCIPKVHLIYIYSVYTLYM